MIRWLGFVALGAGLTLGACSSETTSNDSQVVVYDEVAPEEAIVGRWSDGSNVLTFAANGAYKWEEVRACGEPPCPTKVSNGTWTFSSGKLRLKTSDDAELLQYNFSGGQSALSLSSAKRGKSWSLNKQ